MFYRFRIEEERATNESHNKELLRMMEEMQHMQETKIEQFRVRLQEINIEREEMGWVEGRVP